jgi:hypothetical protein
LFKIWQHDTTVSDTATGYEDDYREASAEEYTSYVYNEYRWVGSNYKGQRTDEIIEIIRQWLKQTYPRYVFSVRRIHYNSFHIDLIKADFTAFRPESGIKTYKDLNPYQIDRDKDLTDRAREVMSQVRAFIMSYNFDDSDSMTDYFNTNFYLHLGVGNYKHPYKIEIPKLKCKKGDEPAVFKHPEGKAHKAIRQALGNAKFSRYDTRRYGTIIVLGTTSFSDDGKENFWPLRYSSAKTAQKRIDKLEAAGIQCKLLGWNGGYIRFEGYTLETEAQLEKERQEWLKAKKAWDRQNAKEKILEPEGAERLFIYL